MCATSTTIAFAGCTPFLAFRVAVLTAPAVAHASGGGDMLLFRERWKSRGRREVCSPCHGEGTVSSQHCPPENDSCATVSQSGPAVAFGVDWLCHVVCYRKDTAAQCVVVSAKSQVVYGHLEYWRLKHAQPLKNA